MMAWPLRWVWDMKKSQSPSTRPRLYRAARDALRRRRAHAATATTSRTPLEDTAVITVEPSALLPCAASVRHTVSYSLLHWATIVSPSGHCDLHGEQPPLSVVRVGFTVT